MRKGLVLPIVLAVLILTAGFAAADYWKDYRPESVVFRHGQTESGSLSNLLVDDGNTWVVNETHDAQGTVRLYSVLAPISDVASAYWARNAGCPVSFASCLTETPPPDGNISYMTAMPAPFESYVELALPVWNFSRIQSIDIYVTTRRNGTAPIVGNFYLMDGVTRDICYSEVFSPGQAFETKVISDSTGDVALHPCGDPRLDNNVQTAAQHGFHMLFTMFLLSGWTVTFAQVIVGYRAFVTYYGADADLTSGTMARGEVPQYFNWTCNSTGDRWILEYWNSTSTAWTTISSDACPGTIMTAYSFVIPTGEDALINSTVQWHLFAAGNVGAKYNVTFDSLIVNVFSKSLPVPPFTYGRVTDFLPYLIIILIFLVPFLIFALWARRRREG